MSGIFCFANGKVICKSYIPPGTHLLFLFDWRDPWICPVPICSHDETLRDSCQSTVDAEKAAELTFPKQRYFRSAMGKERRKANASGITTAEAWLEITGVILLQEIHKEREGREQIKGRNGKGNQDRLQEGNRAEGGSWELSWLQ